MITFTSNKFKIKKGMFIFPKTVRIYYTQTIKLYHFNLKTLVAKNSKLKYNVKNLNLNIWTLDKHLKHLNSTWLKSLKAYHKFKQVI